MALAVSYPYAAVLGIWPVRTMLCAGAQSAQHRVYGRAWATWPSEAGSTGSKGYGVSSSVHVSPEQPLLLAYSAAVAHEGANRDTLDVNALRHSGLVRDLVAFLSMVSECHTGEILTWQNRDALNLRDCMPVERDVLSLKGTGAAGRDPMESGTDFDPDCILRTWHERAFSHISNLCAAVSLHLKWLPDPPPPLPSGIRMAVTFEPRTDTLGADQSVSPSTLSRALCAPHLGTALAALHTSMLCDLMAKLALGHGPLFNGAYIEVSKSHQHTPANI